METRSSGAGNSRQRHRMKLRTKLLALSLLTLLLPWSGWKLLQELEHFLREAQQAALLASARTVAGALPMEYQSRLLFLPELYVPLRHCRAAGAGWIRVTTGPAAGQGLEFASPDGALSRELLAGEHAGRSLSCLMCSRRTAAALRRVSETNTILLMARSPRGLFSFTIKSRGARP